MIFVTVGAQMPFDRLVRAVDRWAAEAGRNDVFAQIGPTDYRPAHVPWTQFLQPDEFRRRYAEARVIVGHAGTGTIINALQLGKPILVMPRRAALRETRNDHQVATAERFEKLKSVAVAWDEAELAVRLASIDRLQGSGSVGPHASPELVDTLRAFLDGADVRSSLG